MIADVSFLARVVLPFSLLSLTCFAWLALHRGRFRSVMTSLSPLVTRRPPRYLLYMYSGGIGTLVLNSVAQSEHDVFALFLSKVAFAWHVYACLGWSRFNLEPRHRSNKNLLIRPIAALLLGVVVLLQLALFLENPHQVESSFALAHMIINPTTFWLGLAWSALMLYGISCELLFLIELIKGFRTHNNALRLNLRFRCLCLIVLAILSLIVYYT